MYYHSNIVFFSVSSNKNKQIQILKNKFQNQCILLSLAINTEINYLGVHSSLKKQEIKNNLTKNNIIFTFAEPVTLISFSFLNKKRILSNERIITHIYKIITIMFTQQAVDVCGRNEEVILDNLQINIANVVECFVKIYSLSVHVFLVF